MAGDMDVLDKVEAFLKKREGIDKVRAPLPTPSPDLLSGLGVRGV